MVKINTCTAHLLCSMARSNNTTSHTSFNISLSVADKNSHYLMFKINISLEIYEEHTRHLSAMQSLSVFSRMNVLHKRRILRTV